MLSNQGPTGVFDSTMSTTITRFCDLYIITASVTFGVLEFKFPTTESEETTPLVTYTNQTKVLRQVKKFKLATGKVLAVFHEPKA
jgi:hypothetical protein